jgi:hypothetical protein
LIEYIQANYFEAQKPIGKPSVITWNGVRMVRSHSIQAVAREIINMSTNQEMVSINAIGKQSTGKTELLKTISHLVHKHAKIPYQISYFGKEEMLNLEETVSSLKPINQILIFDDIAFLKASATNKQIDQIQQVLSVIRHLPGGTDVKIILMKSFQYTKAIPPFLRQNDITFVSSVDDNEIDNLTVLLGKKYYSKINQLKFLRAQGSMGEEGKSNFVFDMGGGKKVIYGWQRPFLPFLYKTGVGCRLIVSPLRTWIDPICNECACVHKETKDKTGDVKQVIDDFISKFKDGNVIRTAVKIKLIQQGINCFSPRIVQAVKYIERMQQERLVSTESLASALELTPTKTLLFPDKQPFN